jgi:RHS repeat-associated protein
MKQHPRIPSPSFIKGIVVILFALFVVAWYCVAEKNPVHASVGDTVPQSVQKGVNFLTPDVINWTKQNSCIACHRQGASLYALSNAKSRGYAVDTSKETGLGFIAQRINDEQQPDGRWTHFGSFDYAKTSYAFFGMSGYDKFVGTEYSRNLVSAANWTINRQIISGPYGYWIEDHGLFPTTYGNVPVTARMMVGIAQAKQRVDSATAALYQQHLDLAAAWLRANRDGIYGNGDLAYTFQVAYALIGLKAAGAANDDPDIILFRDRLLAATSQPTGRGWGYTAGHGADEFNTGIALYALGRVGIKPRTNQTVRDAINWLRDQQVNVAGTDNGYWHSNNFATLDIPTTFAILGLSSYGDLGVDLLLDGADHQVIRSNFAQPQTVTYHLTVENDGAFDATDTYSLNVQGGLPGWTATVAPTSVTLPSGQSSPVMLTVTAPPNLPEALPVEMTVIATSNTDSKISANVKITTYTDPPPPTTGNPTQTVFVEGANATINSRQAVQPLAAQVKDASTNAVIHGPGKGVTTFYVAGIAVGTDVDADGDGIFRLNWTPGGAWTANGPQDLRAVYSGIDLPAPQVDLLPSFAASAINIDLPTKEQPIIQVGGPYSVPEGGSIVLTAVGSNLGGGSASYAWDLDNDGSFETQGQNVNFSALRLNGPGSYTVKAQVVSTSGKQANAETVVNVQNVPPVLILPANQTAVEGSLAYFDLGLLVDPGPDNPWTINVDWGDGTLSSTFNPSASGPLGKKLHAYADSGLYTVTLRAADKDGATDTKSFKIKVFNVPPTVTAAADQTAEAGIAKSFDLGLFADPGPDSLWVADINWGDSSAHTTFNLFTPGALTAHTHTYASNSNYTVTVRVTDKDGGVGSATFKVTTDHIAVVRHAFKLTSGRIEGTIRQLLGENGSLGGTAFITSDLKLPGTPSVRVDGNPAFNGTIEGTGSTAPSAYQVKINGNATLGGHLITRTDPVDLLPLAAPPTPTGTRDVILKQSGQGYGDASTLRDLTLTGSVGQVAVPPGTYRQFTADSHTTLLLGVANPAQTTVYNFQDLRLNGGSALRLAGPVKINVANHVILDGTSIMGMESASRWLKLDVAGDNGGDNQDKVSTRGGSALYAIIRTPLGRITVGGNSLLRGAVACDYLDVSGSGVLHLLNAGDAMLTTNKTPVVNAGPDQTIALPSTDVNLNGLVTDDGQPLGAALSASWSEVSGPGPVIFGNADAASTKATFSEPGTYVLRLTADDTLLVGSDDVSINVGLNNQAPIVSAGLDREIFLPANSTTLAGIVLDDGLPANGVLSKTWSKVSGPGTVTFSSPNELTTDAAFSTAGTYVLRLTASDSQLTSYAEVTIKVSAINQSPVVNAGPDRTGNLSEQVSLSGVVSDDGLPAGNTLVISWTKISGPGTVTFNNASAAATTATFSEAGSYLLRLSASDSQLTTTSDVLITVKPPNQPPTVSAGMSQTITLPDGASLSGMVSDDGLPAGNTLTISWSKVSGPGDVTFGNSSQAVTTAAFSLPGTYVLRLTANDSLLSGSADVTITVNPAPQTNQAPTVNAGPDQIITLPAQANLNGAASDDGLPANSTLSTTWSKVTGPGIVTFANSNVTGTNASFNVAGTYVLRLTATDSQLSNTDDIIITVKEPAPLNQPPTVNAGPAQTVTLPHAANLVGAVNDDGLPEGGSITVQWTKVNGPGTVAFSAPDRVTTTATFSDPGSYVLRLTASDSELSGSGDITITVNGPNKPPTVNSGPDQTATSGTPSSLHGEASDDGLPTGVSLQLTWSKVSGPGSVTFSNPHQAATSATFSDEGIYELRLTASDSELTSSDEVLVTVEAAPAPPEVSISSPSDGSRITTLTNFTGTISNGLWRLEYSLNSDDGSPAQSWTPFASGSGPISNGLLGTFDPTLLLNGSYTVRLIATDVAGQTAVTSVSAVVSGSQKIGNFTVSFTDLHTPVAGLPIEVIRTYDSRDKRVGDFGVGWNLSLKNVRLEKTSVLGANWAETSSGGILPTYCVQPTRPHLITITFPDNKVYQFEATVAPQCQALVNIESARVSFRPMANTHGTLSLEGDNDVLVVGGVPGPVDLFDFNSADIFNSRVFRLTTQEGLVFVIDQQGGVRSMSDPNGNTLTINANGITHSSGKSISFTRDAQGRITHITDPAGNVMAYSYDANGDLISYRDSENNTTTFTYNSSHYLLAINDPRGLQPIRNEYDDEGRLLSHTDAFGKKLTYTHNLGTRQETVTDRVGNLTLYEYDANGNVVRSVDPAGGVKVFTYDANDNLLSDTNELGQTVTYTYDAQDNRTSVTDALGNTTRYTYNSLSKPLTTTDPLGHLITNTYDASGVNLLSTRDPLGNVNSYTYDASTGQAATMTDALGGVTRYEYDASGNLSKETNALGVATAHSYDANGNQTALTMTRTLPTGQVETLKTDYQYDHLNRAIKTILSDGTSTGAAYNEIGQQSANLDQMGRQTTYSYDEMGRLTLTTYPDSLKESFTYDAEGHRLSSTDRAGRVTRYTYDSLGRLTKTTNADGTSSSVAYNALGQVMSETDALGNSTTYEYDAAGRQTKVRDALGHVTTFTYDAAGNQLSMTDARGNVTRYEYDDAGRRTKVIHPDLTTETTTYDAEGHVIAYTDQAGATTQSSYDSLGQLIKVTDALGQVTQYGYDELGQQVSQTDANNHTTRFEYDAMGHRTKRVLPVGMSETYSYDAAGNLRSRTDFNGKTTNYTYDTLNRLISKTPDASLNQPGVSFSYTSTGHRAQMMDATGATTYTYDSQDRLTSKQAPQGMLTYTYGATGNLLTTRSSNANGVSLDYDYDALNRLETVSDNRLAPGANVTTYSYDGVGNLQSNLYPNRVQTSYTYDNLNRLTSLTIGNGASHLASYSYALGAAGNRLSVTESDGRSVQYTYDALYRLTNEAVSNDPQGANGAVAYTYDAVGNRLSRRSSLPGIATQNSTYDANDRLQSDTYDRNGNTVASQGTVYNFDFEDRLSGVNQGAVKYLYDGDGNLVGKRVGQLDIKYLVDTNNPTGHAQVVDELENGSVTRTYTYGHALISQNQILNNQWQASFYGYDGHGNVRLLMDRLGAVTDTYTYDAFGNLIARTGTTPNEHLFVGEQLDANTGFYYLRARYLNPSSGRFLTSDTYEGSRFDPLSLHKYLYAHANPVSNIDPTGNFTMADLGSSMSIINMLNTATRVVTGVVRVYQFVQRLVDFINFSSMAVDLISTLAQPTIPLFRAALAMVMRRYFGNISPATIMAAFHGALSQIAARWSEMSTAFARRVPVIAAELVAASTSHLAGLIAEEEAGTLTKLIYGPSGPGGRTPDNWLRIRQGLEFGIAVGGGRLFGFGARRRSGMLQQMFRLDYWDVRLPPARPSPTPLHLHYHIFGDNQHLPGHTVWP